MSQDGKVETKTNINVVGRGGLTVFRAEGAVFKNVNISIVNKAGPDTTSRSTCVNMSGATSNGDFDLDVDA
jgi:hypothetical protein